MSIPQFTRYLDSLDKIPDTIAASLIDQANRCMYDNDNSSTNILRWKTADSQLYMAMDVNETANEWFNTYITHNSIFRLSIVQGGNLFSHQDFNTYYSLNYILLGSNATTFWSNPANSPIDTTYHPASYWKDRTDLVDLWTQTLDEQRWHLNYTQCVHGSRNASGDRIMVFFKTNDPNFMININ